MCRVNSRFLSIHTVMILSLFCKLDDQDRVLMGWLRTRVRCSTDTPAVRRSNTGTNASSLTRGAMRSARHYGRQGSCQ
ncbi:hypothetical protein HNQ77_001638 [Silvibacterium bohemicum]|uniref:Uncharacterized protein n=1 Tax=Silvibacterium bohemicum TaxID=1577686 RepID=A0A841JVC0_9BACT|nr:hypothetical protein [Silvibacterium bohemicum]